MVDSIKTEILVCGKDCKLVVWIAIMWEGAHCSSVILVGIGALAVVRFARFIPCKGTEIDQCSLQAL